ncbi:golgin subfamily A member 7-like isoform X2 [Gigantopelta aegis]|nr:golgin subfamily A member 7-like isoform X2 [Gigantopelta aegis]XP_041368207.1 golgin subfamily A member 7-like isoform X2 [Gigantopelta aegis]
MDSGSRTPPNHCTKVFLHRDYIDGTGIKFQNKFPSELEGKIERNQFEQTINTLNQMYVEAETLGGRTYCESCFACLTAYLAYLCMDTYYEKCLKKINRYIEEENKNVFVPRGLMLIDPVERGLRVLEICILNDTNRR